MKSSDGALRSIPNTASSAIKPSAGNLIEGFIKALDTAIMVEGHRRVYQQLVGELERSRAALLLAGVPIPENPEVKALQRVTATFHAALQKIETGGAGDLGEAMAVARDALNFGTAQGAPSGVGASPA